jgi:hypothetical protein
VILPVASWLWMTSLRGNDNTTITECDPK